MWWNPYILKAEKSIPNYTVIRNDRTNKEGGGVCFYVHDLVLTQPAPKISNDGIVTLRIKNTAMILVYHPTSYSLSETENMLVTLEKKSQKS